MVIIPRVPERNAKEVTMLGLTRDDLHALANVGKAVLVLVGVMLGLIALATAIG